MSEPIRFPYLLPNILGASLALISLVLVFFFLEETLDVPNGGDRYYSGVARTTGITCYSWALQGH